MIRKLINCHGGKYLNAPKKESSYDNQACYIICDKIDYKIENLLKQKEAEMLSRQSYKLVVKFDNTIWRILKWGPMEGRRCRKIYIDKRIPNEVVDKIIAPMVDIYCEEVNFF